MIEFIPHNPGLRPNREGFYKFREKWEEVLSLPVGGSFDIENKEMESLMSALQRYHKKGMLNFSSSRIDGETTRVFIK